MSFDRPDENKAFAEAESFPYRLLSDVDRTTGEQYGVRRGDDEQFNEFARRYSFLIDPERRIRRIYRVTDTAAHPAEVLNDLSTMR